MTRLIAAIHAIANIIQRLVRRHQQQQAQDAADRIHHDPGAEWLHRFNPEPPAKPADPDDTQRPK